MSGKSFTIHHLQFAIHLTFTLFFSPLNETDFADITKEDTLKNHIHIHFDRIPQWKGMDIAIIGLTEIRGSSNKAMDIHAAHHIRRQLYQLKKSAADYKIVDLGNLKNGIDLEDTYLRIKEVSEKLLKSKVIPVFLGGTNDLMLGQYLAFEHLNNIVSIANIDAVLDLDELPTEGMNKHHLWRIIAHSPNYLFNMSQLAHQAYLNAAKRIEILERLYFDIYGVGKIREDLENLEPIIRGADMIALDICAIRGQDAPASDNAQPFGLTGEEICQLFWFAGLSNQTNSIGIYEYNPIKDENEKTAKVLAVALWYFIEGVCNRHRNLDFESNTFTKYTVPIGDNHRDNIFEIRFYKHLLSNKWWMEVEYSQDAIDENLVETNTAIVPCTYDDYLIATQGELPTRWIQTHAKLL